MIDEGSRWCWYLVVRGEILGPTKDYHQRKHSPSMLFFNQEQKLGDRRWSDTVVVLTANVADQGLEDVTSMALPEPLGKPWVFGFRGEYGRKAET